MNIENRHITIWGDSILKGVILDEEDGRYKVLENNCVSRFAGITGTSVLNHASFGMTTGKALERISKSVTRNPPKRDDIVLIEFGGNDCDYNWAEISANPEADHTPKTPMPLFASTLKNIVDTFKSFNISPVLVSLPPLEPSKYFNWISRGLSKENILHWLGDIHKIYRWQEAYNDIVVTFAKDDNLRLIDVRKNFLVSDQYSTQFCADGIHPNERGHENILDSFLSYVHSI